MRNQHKFFCAEESRELDLTLIDYGDFGRSPERWRNVYEVTDEFYYHNGRYGTREDVVFLINGIPVLVIECKNATKEEGIALGIDQIRRYHTETPEVMVPQMLAGRDRGRARERARQLLRTLGLAERESHRPARLSGGEQQRVAIARAMANRPSVLLADEPTGNLDEDTARMVFEALVAAAKETGAALLIATHNAELAARAHRTVRLHNGLVEPL